MKKAISDKGLHIQAQKLLPLSSTANFALLGTQAWS